MTLIQYKTINYKIDLTLGESMEKHAEHFHLSYKFGYYFVHAVIKLSSLLLLIKLQMNVTLQIIFSLQSELFIYTFLMYYIYISA